MLTLPDSESSYWEASVEAPYYPRQSEDFNVEVAVVGGGIAGLSAAYLLKKSGKTVAVIEKDTIGHGVSNNTTGKVTSQHSMIYNELYQRFGEAGARTYGAAAQAAVEQIDTIIATEHIACDWQRDDNYVYTSKDSEVATFKKEAETAKRIGLPATFETHAPLPFEIKGAVRFSNQARFHIKKYLIGLANAINGNGSYVFENTRGRSTGIRDGKPCTVTTNGGNITTKDIIIATNVPFTAGARGSYCIMEYPQKSYIVAGRPAKPITGMYISPDKEHYSIMPMNIGTNDQLLLIGGESHIPGVIGKANSHYQRLAEYAFENFGINNIDYKWASRDYRSYDNVPLVGKLYPWSKHVYVTTAYRKWGLTNTTVSAIILCDLINDQKNAWAAMFDSNRFKPIASIPRVFASYVGLR